MSLQIASFVLVNIAIFVVCEIAILTHIHRYFKHFFVPRRRWLEDQSIAIGILIEALEPISAASPNLKNQLTSQFSESVDGTDPLDSAVRYLRWTSFLRCIAGALAIALPPAWTVWLFSVIGLV
tara:strand:+ start:71 stop:442 length:372 start_codon:yes stop_codon:yes gene_type:complete